MLSYFERKLGSGYVLKILIDPGYNRNYIQPKFVQKPIPNENSFDAVIVGGSIKITHHKIANLFNRPDIAIQLFFYIHINILRRYFGTLEAKINILKKVMTIKKNIHVSFKE